MDGPVQGIFFSIHYRLIPSFIRYASCSIAAQGFIHKVCCCERGLFLPEISFRYV